MAGQSKRGLSATKSRSSGFKGRTTATKRAGRPVTKEPPAPRIAGEKSVRATTKKAIDLKPSKSGGRASRSR